MPNIYLVRSREYCKSKYWDVFNLLNAFKGVMRFHTKEQDAESAGDDALVNENVIIDNDLTDSTKDQNWFFDQCNQFRKTEDIGDQEMVLLLTDLPNRNNFFNGLDFDGGLNMYVQTSGWDLYFPGSDERYPVVYHIAASILIRKWFTSLTEAQKHLNFEPKGCMMDYCQRKDQVSFKMRTADISAEALQSMRENNVDPNLINHVLSIFEGISKNMLFKSKWLLNPIPQTLTIKGIKSEFYFKDLGNLKINLPTLHRVVYIFLLQYPDIEGLNPSFLSDHKDDLFNIYNDMFIEQLMPEDGEQYLERKAKTDAICNPLDMDNWAQKISFISRKFRDALGEDLSKLYIIQGGSGIKKKVEIDRSYIIYEY